MKKFYLAYGSNLNLDQMHMRCPAAYVVGTAVIPDYELLFKGSKTGSYLTIEKKEGCGVPVAVWAITTSDERNLDRYEGFPTFYYKKGFELPVADLRTGAERMRKCFAYIMDEERSIGIPSDWYVAGCLEGYRSFGFDSDPLYRAVEISLEVCDEG